MAVIEEALVALLEGDADVGALAGDRIYPIVVPAGATLPAIAYQRISTRRPEEMDGPSGLARPRFQFTCVGTDFGVVKALAKAVRAALDGFSGTVSGVMIDGILFEDEDHDFKPATDEEASSWLMMQDYYVWHRE